MVRGDIRTSVVEVEPLKYNFPVLSFYSPVLSDIRDKGGFAHGIFFLQKEILLSATTFTNHHILMYNVSLFLKYSTLTWRRKNKVWIHNLNTVVQYSTLKAVHFNLYTLTWPNLAKWLCTLITVHLNLYTSNSTFYSVHFKQYIKICTFKQYILICTLQSVHQNLYI